MGKTRQGLTGQPQEVPDAEHEQLVARVCAIDVAKASGKVCTRTPHATSPARRVCTVWDVAATTNAVSALADQLVRLQVDKVTVESTADYWRIWFYLLEAAGLDVQLVNAREVKNVPGRPKTDKIDAVWLAKLTEKGLLRPSFVPPAPVRVLRDYTRLRVDLTRERTRHWQRLEKLLEDCLIKVSSVASSLDTRSTRDMIEALIRGERDPRVLAGLARGRMKARHPELVEALTGQFDDHHGELARILLDQIDTLTRQIDQLTTRIDELCPRTIQSGARTTSGKAGKGNPYLKGVLGVVAATASRTDTVLGERYRRLVKRRGKLKALVAVARSILVIIWHLLADPTSRFHDLGSQYHDQHIDKETRTRNHIRQLQALGYTVTLTAA
jgi:transposase